MSRIVSILAGFLVSVFCFFSPPALAHDGWDLPPIDGLVLQKDGRCLLFIKVIERWHEYPCSLFLPKVKVWLRPVEIYVLLWGNNGSPVLLAKVYSSNYPGEVNRGDIFSVGWAKSSTGVDKDMLFTGLHFCPERETAPPCDLDQAEARSLGGLFIKVGIDPDPPPQEKEPTVLGQFSCPRERTVMVWEQEYGEYGTEPILVLKFSKTFT